MTGKSLSELDLKDEPLPAQALDDLPEFGGFAPPPQPGPYRFKLPTDLNNVWEVFEVAGKGQRVRMIFDREAPLYITKSPGDKVNGDTFQTRLSNQERKRGKDGPEVSDLDYLLKAFKVETRPTSNRQLTEVIKDFGGRDFGADITYSYVCNPDRNIRVPDTDGKLIEVPDRKGCAVAGSKKGRYYQASVPRDAAGNYPHELQCECGAILRPFANLDNIRS